MLKAKGFVGEIIDRTPRFGGAPRGEEIAFWLAQNKVDSFVIIDDDSDMCDLMPKLVKTFWQTGLQLAHAEQAIKVLGEKE